VSSAASHGGSGPPSNTLLLGSTRVSSLNGISIDTAVFAQLKADSVYILQSVPLSQKLPLFMRYLDSHLILDSFCAFQPMTQTASRDFSIGSAVFRSSQIFPMLYNGTSTQNCSFQWMVADPHLLHGSLAPRESQPKRHLDRFSCFAGITSVTDRPTDRPTDQVTRSVYNRPNLRVLYCDAA